MRLLLSILRYPGLYLALVAFCLLLADFSVVEAEPLQLTPAEQTWIGAHPVIRTRISPSYPPFEFFENNAFHGMAYDYIDYIAKRLGIRIEPVTGITWQESLDKIKGKSGVDLIILITRDTSRDSFLEFTRNYISFPQVIVTAKEGSVVAGIKDLTGKTVASENGFIEIDYLQRDIKDVRILETSTTTEALERVATGRADAYVGNLAVASYLIDKEGLANLKVAAPYPFPDDEYSMGVRKDWPELARMIDKVLASMSDDEHRQIRQKWLSVRYEHGLQPLDVVKWVAIVAAVLLVFIIQLRRMVRQRTAALHQSLRQLEDAHRKLADIIEFLPDATLVLDRDRRVLAWNRAIEQMTGIPKEQMIGTGNYEYAIPFYGVARPILADFVMNGLEPEQDRYETFSRHGEVLSVIGFTPALYGGRGAYIAATVSPLKDSSDTIVGAIESLKDITLLRAAEAEIKELNEQLESRVQQRTNELEKAKAELSDINAELSLRGLALAEANRKLEAFAYSVSHDLRAPLRHITSFSNLLGEDYAGKLDAEGQHYLQRISAGCQRMDAMITAMLDLARTSSQEIRKIPIDPNSLVQEVLAELSYEHASVSVENLPPCSADPILLKQVYANLIGNALKFSRLQEGAQVEIGAESSNEQTVYFVRDNGIGFDMAYAGDLFGIFKRLQSSTSFEGVGIGLAIVQNIIQRHGGKIWAESSPGEGTTFFFTLAA